MSKMLGSVTLKQAHTWRPLLATATGGWRRGQQRTPIHVCQLFFLQHRANPFFRADVSSQQEGGHAHAVFMLRQLDPSVLGGLVVVVAHQVCTLDSQDGFDLLARFRATGLRRRSTEQNTHLAVSLGSRPNGTQLLNGNSAISGLRASQICRAWSCGEPGHGNQSPRQ